MSLEKQQRGIGQLETDVNVTPTGHTFTRSPAAGCCGMCGVTVEGDEYLIPENIIEGVTIYGVEGTHSFPEQELEGFDLESGVTITPTGQTITRSPGSGFDGLAKVTVSGDSNLIAANIKSGVTVYGVEGSYTGSIDINSIGLQAETLDFTEYDITEVV